MGFMYQAPFGAPADEWVVIQLPFGRFVATYHGQTVDDAPEAHANRLRSVGFLISGKQAGPFRLQIDWIRAYTDR
jgi:NADH dehydrogenase [ubiquinone] 1 alpha subcomplex assembly factor 1